MYRITIRYRRRHAIRTFNPFHERVVPRQEKFGLWSDVCAILLSTFAFIDILSSCAAGAAAGAGLPPVYTVCLEKYGYKVTLIGWGIVTFIVTAIGLFCVHPRVPVAAVPKPTRKDFDFMQKPLFYIILVATIIQALAHYGPSLYLPSFGLDFGLTPTQGSLLVSLLNLAQAIGQPVQGMLAYVPPLLLVF